MRKKVVVEWERAPFFPSVTVLAAEPLGTDWATQQGNKTQSHFSKAEQNAGTTVGKQILKLDGCHLYIIAPTLTSLLLQASSLDKRKADSRLLPWPLSRNHRTLQGIVTGADLKFSNGKFSIGESSLIAMITWMNFPMEQKDGFRTCFPISAKSHLGFLAAHLTQTVLKLNTTYHQLLHSNKDGTMRELAQN